jgi:hypothetical protein
MRETLTDRTVHSVLDTHLNYFLDQDTSVNHITSMQPTSHRPLLLGFALAHSAPDSYRRTQGLDTPGRAVTEEASLLVLLSTLASGSLPPLSTDRVSFIPFSRAAPTSLAYGPVSPPPVSPAPLGYSDAFAVGLTLRSRIARRKRPILLILFSAVGLGVFAYQAR